MLRIYPVSLDMLREIKPLVDRIARADRAHADQLRRSALSVTLNLAEGSGSRGGNRRARYDSALGSARETLANLEAAEAIGYLPPLSDVLRVRLNRIIGTLVKLR
jgi:four helix bundle protein